MPTPSLPPTKPVKCVIIDVDGSVEIITPLAELDAPDDPDEPYCLGDALDDWLGIGHEEADGAFDHGYEAYWVYVPTQKDAWRHGSKRYNYIKNGVAMGVLEHLCGVPACNPKYMWEGKAVIMGSGCRSLTDEEIAKIKCEAARLGKSREKMIDFGEWDASANSDEEEEEEEDDEEEEEEEEEEEDEDEKEVDKKEAKEDKEDGEAEDGSESEGLPEFKIIDAIAVFPDGHHEDVALRGERCEIPSDEYAPTEDALKKVIGGSYAEVWCAGEIDYTIFTKKSASSSTDTDEKNAFAQGVARRLIDPRYADTLRGDWYGPAVFTNVNSDTLDTKARHHLFDAIIDETRARVHTK